MIDLNMVSSIMMNLIVGYINSHFIVTIQHQGLAFKQI
jgi:hypothetical protein